MGDYSNWFQAFIAIFTLAAVMYGARKAAVIAEKSNEVAARSVAVSENSNKIAKDSAVIAERAVITDIIRNLVFEANITYRNHVSSIERDKTLPMLNGYSLQTEIDAVSVERRTFFSGMSEEQSIIKYVVCLMRAVDVGKKAIYNGDPSQNFYKEVLALYLDLSLREELHNKNCLNLTLNRLRKKNIYYNEHNIKDDYDKIDGLGL
ncbi:hypothetical protein Amal_03340 [Acetobacter malorum]|uniref:DUF4760 domain-containing protein n=1 Tax=Acetobacter malorum TaxID=178901 RepID=A0A177G6S4_9PROT|nr:hypothetical protein Amal_03340 [Acetobacter malorum]